MDRVIPLNPDKAPASGPDPDHADLDAAVRRLARTSVLVVGDVMLDRFVYGSVDRVSPEAPVPILTVERELAMPGGAGNVVRNLTALGASVAFVSVVGDDQAGSDLTGLIGGQPNVEPWLLVQGGRSTTVKTRYVSQGQQLLRSDREEVGAIHPKLAERMLRIARDALAATSVTVLSDYAKGVLAGDVPAQVIAAARAAGRKVVVDPKGADYGRYAGADVITPNRRELAIATGMPAGTDAEVVAAARQLRAEHGFGAVLVTQAEDGMTLVADEVHRFPAEAAEVFDVSGAGDTVVAALAAGLAGGLSLQMAARVANIAAGIVVAKVGTAVAREADLLAALTPQAHALRKIVTRDEAAEHVERWRRHGWRTGFANGNFDLLHPGHMHLLEQARGQCDRLVVGVNSDASVRRAKGARRPVQPEAARAAMLAGLAAVDLVVVYEEDTPEATLRALQPEVLIKGADYTIETVVGAELVQGWGGRVFLAELLPGFSTTATVARVSAGRYDRSPIHELSALSLGHIVGLPKISPWHPHRSGSATLIDGFRHRARKSLLMEKAFSPEQHDELLGVLGKSGFPQDYLTFCKRYSVLGDVDGPNVDVARTTDMFLAHGVACKLFKRFRVIAFDAEVIGGWRWEAKLVVKRYGVLEPMMEGFNGSADEAVGSTFLSLAVGAGAKQVPPVVRAEFFPPIVKINRPCFDGDMGTMERMIPELVGLFRSMKDALRREARNSAGQLFASASIGVREQQ